MSRRAMIYSIVRTGTGFGLAYVVMLMGVVWLERTALGQTLIVVTARTTALCLKLMGQDGRAAGTLVTSASGSVDIIYECTAIFPGVFLAAAVLSFPVPVRFKAAGLGIGIPAVVVLNEIRLVSLIYVQGLFPTRFETVHLVVWPAILIIAITGGWLAWARYAIRAHEFTQE